MAVLVGPAEKAWTSPMAGLKRAQVAYWLSPNCTFQKAHFMDPTALHKGKSPKFVPKFQSPGYLRSPLMTPGPRV
uniref:Uncharacterized protein n=1 Tax=Anguilla anguilla TaxID=7936 RepID=A0A0E9X0I4_ANGAN